MPLYIKRRKIKGNICVFVKEEEEWKVQQKTDDIDT